MENNSVERAPKPTILRQKFGPYSMVLALVGALTLVFGGGVLIASLDSGSGVSDSDASLAKARARIAEPVREADLVLSDVPVQRRAPLMPSVVPKPVSAEREEPLCRPHSEFCVSVTSGSPAKTLGKLAAALPSGAAKRYQIRLEIVPLEDGE